MVTRLVQRVRPALMALAAAILVPLALIPAAAGAETFTVDTTSGDVDGSCSDGDCSLLDAIAANNANDNGDLVVDAIEFDGTVFAAPETIQPLFGILIDEPVTINGFTGGSCTGSKRQVGLDLSSTGSGMEIQTGAGAGSGNAGGTTICGLAIYNGATQINIVNSDGNELLGNNIGLDWSGTAGGSNAGPGVSVAGNNNLIGGTTTALHRNVISGNDSHGISISGVAGSGGNVIRNNTIGLDGTGAVAANGGNGITVGSGAKPNVIGGTAGLDSNTISGNALSGIDSGAEIEVKGNRIGTLPDGSDDRANGASGVQLGPAADDSVIGGAVSGGAIGGSCDEDCNLISGNDGAGLNDGAVVLTGTDDVTIAGNYIGTDLSGGVSNPNEGYGVLVQAQNGPVDPATGIEIGTGTEAGMNVISESGKAGVRVEGLGTTDVDISGNNIGTGLATTTVLANDDAGVEIGGDNVSKDNTPFDVDVGVAGELANAISGPIPVEIERASGNFVANNLIGLSRPPGSVVNGSPGPGVMLADGANQNRIGGTGSSFANTIAGRTGAGGHGVLITDSTTGSNEIFRNFIGTDSSGSAAFGNAGSGVRIEDGASDNLVGSVAPSARNVISGNGGSGVEINGAQTTGNLIDENRVGSTPDATGLLANGGHGVRIDGGANGNEITDNFLSGAADGMAGVMISGADGNLVEGNSIGTDLIGIQPFAPAVQDFGVVLEAGASSNTIGEPGSVVSQSISNNDVNGVLVTGAGTDDNEIFGNLIGLTTANIAAPNGDSGVRVTAGASGTLIGAGSDSPFASSPGNTISSNGDTGTDNHGVELDGAGPTTIRGNRIGMRSAGDAVRENLGSGIYVTGSSAGPVIGGAGEGEGNVVSGNVREGIELVSTDGAPTLIKGNILGPGPDGTTPLTGSPGQQHGVVTEASSVVIGGTAAGEGNTIARNGIDGIAVRGAAPPFGVEISGNSIFSNGSGNNDPGIDLFADGVGGGDGVTPNDDGTQDADVGANGFQNFPVITAAESGPAGTAVEGTLDSSAATTFRLEFFSSPAGDTSGNGEGQRFLGSTDVTTDASGLAGFDVDIPVPTPAGQVVTTTATNTGLGLFETSEFSAHVTVAAGVAPDTAIVSGPANGSTTQSRDATLAAAGSPPGDTAEVQCRFQGPGQSGGFAACNGPQSYTGLADGTYTWSARAVDAIGNVDATPAVTTFTVAGFDPPELEPPKARLKVRKKLRVNRLKAKATCRSGPCAMKLKGTATVRLKGKKNKRFKLKPKKANLVEGERAKLKPKFKRNRRSVRKLSKLLKRGGKGKLKLVLVAKNDAGKNKARAKAKKLKPA